MPGRSAILIPPTNGSICQTTGQSRKALLQSVISTTLRKLIPLLPDTLKVGGLLPSSFTVVSISQAIVTTKSINIQATRLKYVRDFILVYLIPPASARPTIGVTGRGT